MFSKSNKNLNSTSLGICNMVIELGKTQNGQIQNLTIEIGQRADCAGSTKITIYGVTRKEIIDLDTNLLKLAQQFK